MFYWQGWMEVSWMKVRRESVAKFYDKKIVEGTLANTFCSNVFTCVKLFTTSLCICLLRVSDCKYRELLARFEKSKILKLSLKNAFRELPSKILFRFSRNLKSLRNSQKTKVQLFASAKMQKRSENWQSSWYSHWNTTRTRGKLSIRALSFFYLKIGSFKFYKHFEGFRSAVEVLPFRAPMKTGKNA